MKDLLMDIFENAIAPILVISFGLLVLGGSVALCVKLAAWAIS